MAVLDADVAILGVDTGNLRMQENKGRDYRGREKGEVSRVRRLEVGWISRGFGGTKSHKGHGMPCYKLILEFDHGGVWVVEKPYDIAFGESM